MNKNFLTRGPSKFSFLDALILLALFVLPLTSTLRSSPLKLDPPQQPIQVRTNLVQVDAIVTDENGNRIENLNLTNFQISEDKHPQKLAAVDYFDVRKAQISPETEPIDLSLTNSTDSEIRDAMSHNHRLIVLYFDLSTLRQANLLGSVKSAKKFLHEKITSADLVTVVAFNSVRLVVPAGFTNNRAILDIALDSLLSATVNNHNNVLLTGTIIAREGLSQMLARFPGRKSVIDFTGPFPPAGRMMQEATDAANTSDISFYEIDARGLTTNCADASAGAETDAALRAGGGCLNSPQLNGTRSGMDRLARDTGGKLFVDLNDFTPFFKQILDESTGYYLLSYESSNQRHDGRYRNISVKLIGVPGAKIKSRPGYTAPKK
jgi:VWFA-related protein